MIKTLSIAVLVLLICAASAEAQAPPLAHGAPQVKGPVQELKGTVIYEPLKVGGDVDTNYHIGGDVCTQGDDHYGPDCAPAPNVPSEVGKASLKLADGRVIDITKTHVAAAAWGEAIQRKDHKGTWDVTYKVVRQRDVVYPLAQVKQHHIEDIEITFPATLGGKIHYVVNVISVDDSDQYLHALDNAG